MGVNVLSKLDDKNSGCIAPIIGGEKELQTVTAQHYIKVSDKDITLEGLCFDREGNLFFVDIFEGNIYRVTFPEKEIEIIHRLPGLNPAAVKIHKDGRLFICTLGDTVSTGSILAMQPDGTEVEEIIPNSAGYCVNDLVFDSKGGFFFTDLRGGAD